MATYQVQTEDGAVYEIETEDPKDQSFSDAFTGDQIMGSIASAPVNIAKGVGSLIEGAGNMLGDFAAGKPMEEVLPSPKTVLMAGAGLIPGGQTLGEYAYNSGAGVNKTGKEYGDMLRDEMANYAVGAAVGGIRNPTVALKERFLPSRAQTAVELAREPTAIPGVLGTMKGTTDKQWVFTKDIAQRDEAFIRNNPTAKIDTRLEGGPGSIQKLKANMEGVRKRASAQIGQTRNIVSELENSNPGVRISQSDVNLRKEIADDGKAYFDHIQDGNPEAALEVEKVADDIFNVKTQDAVQRQLGEFSVQPKKLSLTEAEEALDKLDERIRINEGYDISPDTKGIYDSSVRDSTVKGLKILRYQLKEAIADHIKSLDDSLGESWSRAKSDLDMVIHEGKAVDRLQAGMVQGFGPSTEGSLNTNTRLSGESLTNPNTWIPEEVAQRQKQMRAMRTARNTVQQLQDVISARQNQIAAPLPRDWFTLKANSANAYQAGILAMNMGLIGSPDQFTKLPDAVGKDILQKMVIASGLQGLNMFAPSVEGYLSEANGRLAPNEMDMHKQEALKLADPEKRAEVLGAALEDKYKPITTERSM